jgi:hypothetical protein
MPGCCSWPRSRPRPAGWALEGTGCYGAGLTRFLVDHGEWVVEIGRLTTPRQRGPREALRVLHITRAGVVAAGADARRQLKALIVTAPSRCATACGGGPGASSSAAAPGLWLCLVIRWSTGPACRPFA